MRQRKKESERHRMEKSGGHRWCFSHSTKPYRFVRNKVPASCHACTGRVLMNVKRKNSATCQRYQRYQRCQRWLHVRLKPIEKLSFSKRFLFQQSWDVIPHFDSIIKDGFQKERRNKRFYYPQGINRYPWCNRTNDQIYPSSLGLCWKWFWSMASKHRRLKLSQPVCIY